MPGRGRANASLVTNTMSPRSALDHPRRHERHELLGAEQVHLHLCGEVVGRHAPRRDRAACRPALETSDLDGAEALPRGRGERLDRRRVGEVERSATASPPSARISVGDRLAAVDAPGAEHDRVPGRREATRGGRADPGRRAGDDGRTALRVRRESRHQLGTTTVVGSDAKPRTFTECTRRMPACRCRRT